MPRKYRSRRYSKKTSRVPRSVKKYVARAVHRNVETKRWEQSLSSTFPSVGGTWVETDLTNLSQSLIISGRIGREIKLRSFSAHGVLVGGQANTISDDNYNTVRIVLALWDSTTTTPCQSNGLTIGGGLLKATGYGRGLIKKIVDKTIILRSPGQDSTGYMPAIYKLSMFKKLYSIVKYQSNSSTSAQTKLILSILSDSTAIPHPGFTSGRYVITYEDA